MNSLAVITLFIALHVVFILLVALMLNEAAITSQKAEVEKLKFTGVLYMKNDKAIDCYRHVDTNAVYYKQGLQYRSAITGRIVSNEAALSGWF